jgi:uncharacterized protein (TIRG00374 family)
MGVNRLARPIIRKDFLSPKRARDFAHEIAGALATIGRHPGRLRLPFILGLMNKAILMLVLLCTFEAFGVSFSAGTIVAGFSLGYLLTIVSVTPSGIGVVEALMPVALRSLRVDWSQAAIITLVYRALTFWLPFGAGALAFRLLARPAESH